jgi:sugar phosphate isomerase/epimerase
VLLRVELPVADADLPGLCVHVSEAGFDGVELAMAPGNESEKRTDASGGPSRLVDIPERGMRIGALAAHCTTTDVLAGAAEVAALLEQAASLGAQCLNLTIAPIASYQAAINFAYNLLHRVRFEAERSGVAVALEAGAGGFLLSPVELREIIDAANSWAVGVCVDTRRIAVFSSPIDWITTLKHRVHSVRVPGIEGAGLRPPDTLRETGELAIISEALGEMRDGGPVISHPKGDK